MTAPSEVDAALRDGEYPLTVIAGLLNRPLTTVYEWVRSGALPVRSARHGDRMRRVACLCDAQQLDRDRPRDGRRRPPKKRVRPPGHLNQRPAGDGTPSGLTDQQRDCLRAICELGTAQRAADELGLSLHTVRMSVRAVASKLGLYAPGDRSMRSLPLACYYLGRWDESNGVEAGWFADDDPGTQRSAL